MAPIIDTTIGGWQANSYVTVAEADALAANFPWYDDWNVYTGDQKTTALVAAALSMNTLPWCGDKCHPSTDKPPAPQNLAFPRSTDCDGIIYDCTMIPQEIKMVQVILAMQFLNDPTDWPGWPGGGGSGSDLPAGLYVKREKLDVMEIEYDQYDVNSVNAQCDNCDDPWLIQRYPWLKDWLGCLLCLTGAGNNRIIRLLRN